jgi:NADP-dependent 3-hydroxy acid dehydrogenase YdfG
MTAKPKPRALVTGAASGIGRAISFELCAAGYDVTALGRSAASLAEMSGKNGIEPLVVDLADRAALTAATETEPFDVLVNNAGVMPPVVGFSEMDPSDIDATLEINLSAAFHVTRLVIPAMIAQKRGHVFFTGSTAGHAPFPNMAVYGATKAAIAGFAAALRCDLSGTGVRVTEIVAGRVETALYRDALSDEARAEMYAAFQAVQPEDVATMLRAVLDMPPHVDVTRFDILPTAQFVGGGSFAKEGGE